MDMSNMICAEELVDTKSRSYRMKHVDLKTPCITSEKIYEGRASSIEYRKALAEFTNTTLPSGNEYHACHACNNGKCINPEHIYWGTPKENSDDLVKYYNEIWEGKGKKWITKRDIMTAYRLRDYDEDVKNGHILEMHNTTNPVRDRLSANICDTIRIEIPEDKKYLHAYYTIKVNPHRLAKPKNIKSNLLCDKNDFHRAAVSSIVLYFQNHHQKNRRWVPTKLAEKWLWLWDRGRISTKEDLHSLYDKWNPNNLVIYPLIYEKNC